MLRRFLNTLFFTLLLAGIAGAGIFAGYNAVTSRSKESAEVSAILVNAHTPRYVPPELPVGQPVQAVLSGETFLAGATLRFEYHYRNGETAEVWEMAMPLTLIDKTIEDLEDIFPLWVVSANDRMSATLRRELPPKPQQSFLVSATDEGLVAVFFNDSVDSPRLKEVTSTSLRSLPEAERERLLAGILVQGEDLLMRLLEDLGS